MSTEAIIPDRRLTGTCNVPGCDENIPTNLVMCREHWFKVSSALRESLLKLSKGKSGRTSVAYQQYLRDAIRQAQQ